MNNPYPTYTHMKIGHQLNQPSRFFADMIFRGGVKASGLLVIMTFVALISTLIYRAAPIFYHPEVTFTAFATADSPTILTDNQPPQLTMNKHDLRSETLPLMANRFTVSHDDRQFLVHQKHHDIQVSFPLNGELIGWQVSQQPNVFYAQVHFIEDGVNWFQLQRFQLLSTVSAGLDLKQEIMYTQSFQEKPPYAVVGESDIHNILHIVFAVDGMNRYVMLNSVTFEPLIEQMIENFPTETHLSELTLSFYRHQFELYNDQHTIQGQLTKLHSAITLSELFQSQQYVGYEDIHHLWQTSPALDFQDRKYNIAPLLIGSAKASLLALIVAIPLALGSAVYVGYFAPRVIQRSLKPLIEVLEAVPSVAIGLIAAIWLVPLSETTLLSFLLFLILLPCILIIAHGLFLLAKWFGLKHIFISVELGIQLVLTFGLVWLCFEGVSDPLNEILATSAIDIISLDKSTLVVAIALGIAISPTIFSLAEDAISGVSNAMIKAASALGATRIQTLQYVLLPAAAPGIIAAVMIGLGRAFGETLIVLMVTGNTPIAKWDIFAGLRSLSANLVIELPEANQMNSHMTVLFITALLLFLFTFVLNSVAELIKYRYSKSQRGIYD